MRCFVLLFSLLTLSNIVVSQSTNFITDQVTGNLYKPNAKSNVEGTPLLFSDWVPGVLFLKDGYKADKFLLNMDLYANELLFQHNGNALVVVNPLKEFVLMPNGQSNPYIFRAGFLAVDKNSESTFYQVLQDGPVALLKLSKKIILERKEYNQPLTQYFDLSETYYIVKAGQAPEKISKSKASLVGVIGDRSGKLETIIEKKRLRCKTEEDLIEVVKAFNGG